jgi:hypothetical protein
MLIGHFWMQAFDLAQQTAICWRPLWTVRGKPLPLPAVKLRHILANTGRTKQAKNALALQLKTSRCRKDGGGRTIGIWAASLI